MINLWFNTFNEVIKNNKNINIYNINMWKKIIITVLLLLFYYSPLKRCYLLINKLLNGK